MDNVHDHLTRTRKLPIPVAVDGPCKKGHHERYRGSKGVNCRACIREYKRNKKQKLDASAAGAGKGGG